MAHDKKCGKMMGGIRTPSQHKIPSGKKEDKGASNLQQGVIRTSSMYKGGK